MCLSWFPVFSTVISLFCRHCYSCSPYTESHNVWRLHEFIVCVFSKSELRTPWLYPLCSDWLFQACSVCETAHVKSRAPIDRVLSSTCTEMKRMLWSGQRYMNGVSDRLQIEKTYHTACQKKIKLRNWLLFAVCHILERFRNFSPYWKFPCIVKTRGSVSFFLMTIIFITSWLLNRCCVLIEGKQPSTVFPRMRAHAPIM